MCRLLAAVCVTAFLTVGWSMPAGADVTPQRAWQQLHSAHFRVMGDVSPRALRQVVERMEQLHELLTMLSTAPIERPADTTVLVFRNRAAYRPFQPAYNGVISDVGGYFQPGPMNYITLLISQESEEQSVVYHEYVHLVMSRGLGEVAPWIGEGLADFYSTFDATNGGKTARLGGMLQRHLWTLQSAMLPLDTLVQVTHDSPYYNERDKNTVFYAESWALVHYLQLGAQRKYAPKFGAFLQAIITGTPFATACESVLGVTAAALEQELKRYVFAPVLYRAELPLPARLSRLERLEVSPVPEADVHAVLGDLVSRLDGRPDGRAHLDHALAVDGKQALALATLARLEAEAGKLESAQALATRPAVQGTFQTEYYRAVALERVGGDTDAQAPLIEAALRASLALNPSFAPALEALSRRLGESANTRPEALRLITSAMALAPARDDYRLQLARIHLLDRALPEARAVLGPLAARGSSAELKMAARRYLAYSADLDKAASEARDRDVAELPAEPAASDTLAPPAPPGAPSAPSEPAPTGAGDPRGGPSGVPSGTGEPPAPVLRRLADGEVRVYGMWTAVECDADGVVIVAAVNGADLRVRAAALDSVEFISFRNDAPTEVGCGPQKPLPVLITYQPGRVGRSAGIVAAIEFMPNGYRPPGR